ncbi:MAG TPA: class I SAM-dependent methyltransferase [Candidatus Binatia bacterium]|jgi:SAM-dependent methyltransferase|nr:class I SAM-dependent methyltransferase [Candidatus Binatia bacterium]
MSNLSYRRSDCRLCHGTELDLVLKLTPTPLADAYIPSAQAQQPQPVFPLDLFLCRRCGFAQLLDVVQAQAIYLDYIYETVSSLGLVEHFDHYAAEVLGRIRPPAGALVVDVGSNDGTLLKGFQRRGMKVLGIDPAREIAARATAAGVETLPEFFTVELAQRLRRERGPAAIITANNVIANIDDLDGVIAAVRELLAPDGVFVFESYYLGDLVRNMVFDFIYHEHISSFAVKPVELFFRRHGLELVDVLRVPTKGGSLRYTIQLAGGPRKATPIVGELRELEARQGLDTPELFHKFNTRIEQTKQATLALLRRLKGEGKKIAGYGASATTTTLVYHFELAGLLDYLLDDYPAKQGLLSPGLHLPVLPSEVIYERRPDYIVVLAWRYYEPIRRKHPQFAAQGGRFVVPMPELRLL